MAGLNPAPTSNIHLKPIIMDIKNNKIQVAYHRATIAFTNRLVRMLPKGEIPEEIKSVVSCWQEGFITDAECVTSITEIKSEYDAELCREYFGKEVEDVRN